MGRPFSCLLYLLELSIFSHCFICPLSTTTHIHKLFFVMRLLLQISFLANLRLHFTQPINISVYISRNNDIVFKHNQDRIMPCEIIIPFHLIPGLLLMFQNVFYNWWLNQIKLSFIFSVWLISILNLLYSITISHLCF